MKVALFHHVPSTVEEISSALAGAGDFAISPHSNALVGLGQVSSSSPDVVLAAGDLPIIDGFQLCLLMKSQDYPKLNGIPVVLLGEDRLELAQRAKECGAVDYVTWPQAPAVLAFALNRAAAGSTKTVATPVVLVVGERDETWREVKHDLGGIEGLELIRAESPAAMAEVDASKTIELVVVDSEPESLPELVSKHCEEHWPGVSLIVATTDPAQSGRTRRLRATVSRLVSETAAAGELGDVCRYQLRKRQAQRASPRAREDILAYFFEAATTPLLVVSAREGTVRVANDAAVHLMRVSRKQLERGSLHSAFPPAKRTALRGLLAEANRKGLAHTFLEPDISGNRVGHVSITRLGWADLCLVTLTDRGGE